MAYTAKCDTASATRWWITGTGSAVNRLSEVMDDNLSGVEEDDNPGNYQPWSTFMTEHVEDGMYQIHLDFRIGNGSITTILISENEFVWFDDGAQPYVRNNGTLQLGALGGSNAPVRGAAWRWQSTLQGQVLSDGWNPIISFYASLVQILPSASGHGPKLNSGATHILKRCIINEEGSNQYMAWQNIGTTITLSGVYISDGLIPYTIKATPILFDNIVIGDNNEYVVSIQSDDVVAEGLDWYASGAVADVLLYNASFAIDGYVKNPKKPIGEKIIGTYEASTLYEQYTVNVHITDKDGANLQSVTVTLDGSDSTNYDTQQFSVSTAANGTITEQTITVKKWVGTSETETDYNLHRFTISKVGYETLILENIIINDPIDWYLELQSQKQSPAPWQEGMM